MSKKDEAIVQICVGKLRSRDGYGVLLITNLEDTIFVFNTLEEAMKFKDDLETWCKENLSVTKIVREFNTNDISVNPPKKEE